VNRNYFTIGQILTILDNFVIMAKIHKLLCVDYVSDKEKGENLQFIFYGGVLSDEQIRAIQLPKDELSEYKICKSTFELRYVSDTGSLERPISDSLLLLSFINPAILNNDE
jgi:hypothetical protein